MPIEGAKHRLTCRFVEASASEIAGNDTGIGIEGG